MSMLPHLTELEIQLSGPDGATVRRAALQTLLDLRERFQKAPGVSPLPPRDLSVLRAGIEGALATLRKESVPTPSWGDQTSPLCSRFSQPVEGHSDASTRSDT